MVKNMDEEKHIGLSDWGVSEDISKEKFEIIDIYDIILLFLSAAVLILVLYSMVFPDR